MPRSPTARSPGERPPSADKFKCSLVRRDEDAACVHVAGELDIATAPALKMTLREALGLARLVVLDLRDLTFVDSCGVHVIIDASVDARTAGRRLVVLPGPVNVDRVFSFTGNLERIEIGRADSVGMVCDQAS